jgi:hypothetical protein
MNGFAKKSYETLKKEYETPELGSILMGTSSISPHTGVHLVEIASKIMVAFGETGHRLNPKDKEFIEEYVNALITVSKCSAIHQGFVIGRLRQLVK